MAVWITGDIHGNSQRFSTDIFPEQKEMSKDDVVIYSFACFKFYVLSPPNINFIFFIFLYSNLEPLK